MRYWVGGSATPGRWALVARTAVSAVAAGGLVAGCSRGEVGSQRVPASEVGHVHDLVVDGEELLVASHRGVLRVVDGRLEQVSADLHDLMSMASTADGDLVASGHPDLRVEEFRVAEAPPFLGLVRSADRGESWEVVDLLGEVDFHALAATAGGVVGAGSTGDVWELDVGVPARRIGSLPFDPRDLAVAPNDPTKMVATSYDGEVAMSDDGGSTWQPLETVPELVEIEWTTTGVTGATATGQIWWADTPDGEFEQSAVAPGVVDALLVTDEGVWVAVEGGGIFERSGDGNWVPLVNPAR